jgi:thiamine biosynthesis lipoprotein
MGSSEAVERFFCFGAPCAVLVIGAGREGSALAAARAARGQLLEWHHRFSRFLPTSELSLLNSDLRAEVPVSALMARLARAAARAGAMTGGLVDATLIEEIESAGYRDALPEPVPLATALRLAPARRPAAASKERSWELLQVDPAASTVSRPPGVKLDSGGLVKGLLADVLAERLADRAGFAINCGGDLRFGGTAGIARELRVESPFDGGIVHSFALGRAGVATSGIGRRSWTLDDGRPAHHLLDPSSGESAFTGVVQVTALASSALLAEIRAKAAVLSGAECARSWLPDGGVIVFDDGSHEVVEPPARMLAAGTYGVSETRLSIR